MSKNTISHDFIDGENFTVCTKHGEKQLPATIQCQHTLALGKHRSLGHP